MTKEKLIALSDLNREDNIKYISSEAQGIAITLDSDRYAPNLCKLERAYICGRRKSEEQIEELEKENAELKETVIKMNNVITETFSKLTKAKEIIKIMKHLLFDVWGYIDFPFEEMVNKFLNEGVGMSNKVYNDNLDYSHHIEEQLTKAKELLKQWLQTSKASSYDNINIVTDTEQFLKECK